MCLRYLLIKRIQTGQPTLWIENGHSYPWLFSHGQAQRVRSRTFYDREFGDEHLVVLYDGFGREPLNTALYRNRNPAYIVYASAPEHACYKEWANVMGTVFYVFRPMSIAEVSAIK